MNPAARLVIAILGIIAMMTVGTICKVAWVTNDVKDVKDVALLAIGAVAGVLAKVGFDAAKDLLHPQDVKVVNPDSEPVPTEESK